MAKISHLMINFTHKDTLEWDRRIVTISNQLVPISED